MKYQHILLGFAFIAGLASCSDEAIVKIDNDSIEGTKVTHLSAEVTGFGAVTRSELYREVNDINFRWSLGDKLGVFPDQGNQVSFTIDNNQAGQLTAVFDGGGWALKPSHSYSVYFPYIKDASLRNNNIPMDYTGQTQDGPGNYYHLGKYDYLASDAKTPTQGNLKFTMNHMGAVLILKLKVEQPAKFTKCVLAANNEVFTEKATLDISGATPVISSVEKSKEMTLLLQHVETKSANEDLYLSMMVYPTDLSNETLHVYLYQTDGTFISATINNPRNIEQGKPYQLTADMPASSSNISTDIISFADPNVKAICLQYFDTDNDQEISYAEAAAVTEIPVILAGEKDTPFSIFANDYIGDKAKVIHSFNEFKYFTSLTKMADYMFVNQSELTEVALPESLTSIGYSAFSGCTSLASIDIPEKVTALGSNAFNMCSSLTSLKLPDGLTNIGPWAFRGCSNLININIPDGVNTIGYSLFYDCSSLASIDIPSSVTSIKDYAFQGCSSLESVVIPSSVTSIDYGAFLGCSSLTSFIIPNTVTTLGTTVFAGCSSLVSVEIPDNFTELGGLLFRNCSSLASIEIPNSVTTLGNSIFDGCTSLTSIIIPPNVNTLNYGAFKNCTNLTSITVLSEDPPVIKTFLYNSIDVPANCTIYVPANSVDKYKNDANWSEYANQIAAIPAQ